ncbi:MAG: HU family DNA-binding protein [Lachnospiraceae bacterium]|nr:HU family DNA-binding protein [Lachnospiraceae bacterium]
MDRVELTEAIAKYTGLRVEDSEKAVKAFVDVVVDELRKGGKVQLQGFAGFEVEEEESDAT